MSDDKLREALEDCVGWMEDFARTESDPGTGLLGVLYLAQAALADSGTAKILDNTPRLQSPQIAHADAAPVAWQVAAREILEVDASDILLRAHPYADKECEIEAWDDIQVRWRNAINNLRTALYAHPQDAPGGPTQRALLKAAQKNLHTYGENDDTVRGEAVWALADRIDLWIRELDRLKGDET